ncbi:velvet factor, partial [Dioszegia hungarica]
TGETIQTPEKLRLLDERQAALCVFAKLSIRMPGMFRLKFTLYETSKLGLCEVGHTVSEPFEVFSPKLFTGMRESTLFTRHLATQGIKIKLRTDTNAGRA